MEEGSDQSSSSRGGHGSRPPPSPEAPRQHSSAEDRRFLSLEELPISRSHGFRQGAPPESPPQPPISAKEERFRSLEGTILDLENKLDKLDKFLEKLESLRRGFPKLVPAMEPSPLPPLNLYGCYQPPQQMPPQPSPLSDPYSCYQPSSPYSLMPPQSTAAPEPNHYFLPGQWLNMTPSFPAQYQQTPIPMSCQFASPMMTSTFAIPNTDQWYQLYNYGFSHDDQLASQSTLKTFVEDCTISSASNWNQRGTVEYPPNMVFDLQYPEWYYDTITQQWYTLESYTHGDNTSSNSAVQEQPTHSASTSSVLGLELSQSFYGGIIQSEQNNIQSQDNQDFGGNWNAYESKYTQENSLCTTNVIQSEQQTRQVHGRQKSVVPAFERTGKAMFEQVDTVLQKGISEHDVAQQQFESMHTPLALTLRDATNSPSSITQNVTSELAVGQRKLLALVAGNTKALNPIGMQESIGPMAAISEMALSVQQVEVPLDQTKELSRLISEHKFGEAFTMALQRGDVSIVSWLCSQEDLHATCSMVPLPLNQGVLLPSKLSGLFAMKIDSSIVMIRVKGEGELEVTDKIQNHASISDAISFIMQVFKETTIVDMSTKSDLWDPGGNSWFVDPGVQSREPCSVMYQFNYPDMNLVQFNIKSIGLPQSCQTKRHISSSRNYHPNSVLEELVIIIWDPGIKSIPSLTLGQGQFKEKGFVRCPN